MPVRKSAMILTGLLAGCFFTAPLHGADKATAKEEAKAKAVQVGDLKLKVPATWKKVKPSSRLRTGQFAIPPAKGEKSTVDYVIYHFGGGGGGVGANVKRWIGQFESDGRKVKVSRGTAEQGKYVLVDITGTYKKPIGPPIRRMTKKLPNARMMAVIIQVASNRKVYFIKVAGEKKTVNANASAIRASFGGNAKKEEVFKLPGQK